MSRGLRRSEIGALGGLGMRSGVVSLALGSSRNSVRDGKGRIVPGLSVSLRWSNTADAGAGTGADASGGDGTATGGVFGSEEVGGVILTCKQEEHVQPNTIRSSL